MGRSRRPVPRLVRPELPGLLLAFLLTGCGILLAGCGIMNSPSLVRNYYTLDYVPHSAPLPASQRPYPYALQVGKFEVERATNRQNIVYRFSRNQLQYYERERWAVRPNDMIRDMVYKHLSEARLCSRLGLEFPDRRPDFRLEGMVEALERLDAGDLFFGHLAMTMKLVQVETGTEVWVHSFDQRRRVGSREMNRTVQAISDILQAEMNVVVAELDSLFLAAAGGQPFSPWTPPEPAFPPTPEVQPEPVPGLDESTFEIIRER